MKTMRDWSAWLGVVVCACVCLAARPAAAQADFRRGDANGDGVVDISDVFDARIFDNAGGTIQCWDAFDANDDSQYDPTDIAKIFYYLFIRSSTTINDPGPITPGPDPTTDRYDCQQYPSIPAPALDPNIVLGFQADSQAIVGSPGDTKTIEVFATLTTKGIPDADFEILSDIPTKGGPQMWSIGMTVTGAAIREISLKGIIVDAVSVQLDGMLYDHYDWDLGDTFLAFSFAETVVASPHGLSGAISAVSPYAYPRAIRPNVDGEPFPWPIARITLEVTIPPADIVSTVILRYQDGVQGSGRPVTNAVTLNYTTHLPVLGSFTLYLNDCNGNGVADGLDIGSGTSRDCNSNGIPDECDLTLGTSEDINGNSVPDECDPDCNGNGVPDSYEIAQGTVPDLDSNGIPDTCEGGRLIPGDGNGDGRLDISDAVAALGVLFLGIPAGFPCGEGSPRDPANVALMDWQPDGGVDISDAVAMLNFLFLGGSAHTLAVPGAASTGCVRIAGCPDWAECP